MRSLSDFYKLLFSSTDSTMAAQYYFDANNNTISSWSGDANCQVGFLQLLSCWWEEMWRGKLTLFLLLKRTWKYLKEPENLKEGVLWFFIMAWCAFSHEDARIIFNHTHTHSLSLFALSTDLVIWHRSEQTSLIVFLYKPNLSCYSLDKYLLAFDGKPVPSSMSNRAFVVQIQLSDWSFSFWFIKTTSYVN